MTPERIAELLNPKDDYRELRLAVAALKGGPWFHSCLWVGAWKSGFQPNGPCHKCGKTPCKNDASCAIPDPDLRPLEVVAGELRDEVGKRELWNEAYDAILEYAGELNWMVVNCWFWFAWKAAPAEQIVCCLQAMEDLK